MTISVATIIDRAGHELQDTDHVRWTSSELVAWVNEAAKATVTRRPDAGAYTDNFTLATGTKQAIPSGTYLLLDVVRNMGTGATPGRPVSQCDRHLLEDSYPSWHSMTPANDLKNFCYDPSIDKATFYVYPPAVAGRVVECIFSRFPAEATSATGTLAMSEAFEESILNFVLYRAFAKDSEYGDPAKAVAFFNAFKESLGGGAAK